MLFIVLEIEDATMQNYQVEVDEELFLYVQQHAEPLVDNFNSTIKRLLGLSDKALKQQLFSSVSRSQGYSGLSLSRDVPQSLCHILEVVDLVFKYSETRPDATRIVAKKYGVAPQTVLDKYCRQLNLTAAEFDRLLDEPQLNTLRIKLKKKFSEHSDLIDEMLSDKFD